MNIYRGIVVGNPIEGKVKVRIPKFHGLVNTISSVPNDKLPLAEYCAPSKDSSTPEDGDYVLLVLEDDRIRSPLIIGYLHSKYIKEI